MPEGSNKQWGNPEMMMQEENVNGAVLLGIYDTKDNVWMGDENGPVIYTDPALAKMAAQIKEDQVYGNLGMGQRFQMRPLPQSDSWRLRDHVPLKYGAEEGVRRAENAPPDKTL